MTRSTGWLMFVFFGLCLFALAHYPKWSDAISPIMRLRPKPIEFPKIVPSKTGRGNTEVNHTFLFEGTEYQVRIFVDTSVYEGTKNVDKAVKIRTDLKGHNWNPAYQVAMIGDPAQTPFYGNALNELRNIRDKQQLDDDRYAELIALFVQSIPYCTMEKQDPKYPIEAFVDGCGDCDDKSRLMAALLSREGYDVVLFVFHEEAHMAAGIAISQDGYRSTGYTYIETTSPSYIGFPSYEYSDMKLASEPELIYIGEGNKTYNRVEQVLYLHETLIKQRELIEAMQKRIDEMKPLADQMSASYNELAAQLDNSQSERNVDAYNAIVHRANQLGEERNRIVKEINTHIRRANHSAKITNYIIDHPDDRQGVYKWVKEMREY